ncbi:NAD-dependent epimerase [Leptospira levettii]|uniref:NAD-dependent epimerase/dehydratase family protein n=1 Tax=Leptospira levettii TaxID=2023178 RepID=UPI000C2995A8|nr:SDR family oxidoreductase [Leptospira levettii]MCW7472049.1 SDR family oxidoreductase [Leptospira levettii]PJZ36178.1 NAD-dependent epimerase [Leptospira levettii]PJZ90164.1 NAD-dependent epimerase [Leptospira levettii]PJZ99850.1 NAD-dependent epimerase [Leptospira levettii]
MKKILLIGNMGYIGPVLLKHLVNSKNDYEIYGYDLGLFGHCLFNADEHPEYYLKQQYYGDVRKFEYEILNGFNAVVYLAAISNDPMGKEFEKITHEINHNSASKIAEEAKKRGVKSFIFASSCSVYGEGGEFAKVESDELNPLSAYAISKVEAEKSLKHLADSNFTVTCLRFATACGASPRLRLDLILNDFVANSILNKKIQILSDGTPLRPLINVKDMSRAMEWGIQRSNVEGGEYLVINTGANDWNFSVLELAEEVSKILGGVQISINKDAAPDKRSYKVNFDLFNKLSGEYSLKEKIEDTIQELAKQIIDSNFRIQDFYRSDLIRLNVLRKMINKGVMK